MLKHAIFLGLGLAAGLAACKNDQSPKNATEVVQTVQKPVGENAAVVHNEISATQSSDTVNVARIEFEQMEFDFGEAKEGAHVKHNFKFKNTGRVPLIISDARATCGCTVPEWPKEAIPVGGSGVIKADFNTEGKTGPQNKQITITANTNPSQTIIALRGNVKPKK